MNPMIDESVLRSTRELQLTTHRVRMRTRDSGGDDVISMMLEQVASCGIVRRTKPALLWLAVLCVVLALIFTQFRSPLVGLLVIVAVALGIAFLATRRQYLVIASAGETIRVRTAGVGLDEVLGFVDELEAAKNIRFLRGAP